MSTLRGQPNPKISPVCQPILAAIDANHFFAGIVLRDDRVVRAAPIVRYMLGWERDKVRAYCKQKGWAISVVVREHSPG